MKHEIGIWFDSVPPHTQPGTTSDYFLAVGIDSDVPKILVYIHAERTWTAGGGDTQRVRLWAHIPPLPNAPADRAAVDDTVNPIVCPHCMKLEDECDCSDADVCSEMGDK